MTRMMVEIDDELLEKAKSLSGARTKRQTIEIALRELVRRLHFREVARHAGQVELDLTQEQLRRMREEPSHAGVAGSAEGSHPC